MRPAQIGGKRRLVGVVKSARTSPAKPAAACAHESWLVENGRQFEEVVMAADFFHMQQSPRCGHFLPVGADGRS